MNDDDLLRLRGESIELAYPFSTSPITFVVGRRDGRERFAWVKRSIVVPNDVPDITKVRAI